MLTYIILTVLIAALVSLSRSRAAVRGVASLFFGLQAALAVWILCGHVGAVSSRFFTFDELGTLFFLLMTVISTVAFFQSGRYLDSESLRQHKVYYISLMLLCMAASAVYFANNLAVTWVFLEATTLATAGLVYHRRSERSLEATWKYIFVCSTGIAIAYLGILLVGTAAVGGEMSYRALAETVARGNPLYLKIAFLFILVGYSCKLEIFPLYTIGVDANMMAPTPASAVISTVLVNAGFVSLLRIYKVIALSPIYPWASKVLILAGVISVLIGAVYLRRTNNLKRFFSYSTVENMGLAAVALGVGGLGIFAALFHVTAHSFIKSGLFFNAAQIGKLYGTYRMNRIGDYLRVNRLGAAVLLAGLVCLIAFPPSALFLSELMILRQIIADGSWWLLGILVLLLCAVMYTLCQRILIICYKPAGTRPAESRPVSRTMTWTGLGLILCAVALGVVQPPALIAFINAIIAL